ncbi:ABC transporter ATP-binding protein [Geobacter pelophilus]|uniref:ABC transporter ATP-binding protein n=1 Tax=Geoanaerobacter pelophilus TaxID=60036 RepID=A0AAW4KXY2_9BACT|nr:ATP-binding cassette domain-containing protein [Geoanaerobacter pelophilus]MBT0663403.1 ABC transporter ATP-binding protein [Geoanaerobacter pelophilus]
MTDDIAIKVENLSKVYKLYNLPVDRLKESLHPFRKKYHHDFFALNDVSFEIKKGEAVGIIGKNGSGKSTLLKILTGVLTPSCGAVHVNGKVAALLELGAGFNPELSGIENVYFNGMLMGYTREEMENRLDEILSFADIGDFVHQPVKSYSSGMFVRLAFSVAISVEPEILIIDEALSVGDMFFQAKCMTVLDRFRRKGCTILFVSHNIQTIKSLCQRAVHISKGKIVGIGDAAQISDAYMREIREDSEHRIETADTHSRDGKANLLLDDINSNYFKIDESLDKLDSKLRYGSGEARFKSVELLNEQDEPIVHADYDDIVKIKLCVECYQHCVISVNYNIRDEYNINIIGSDFTIEGSELIEVAPHDRYIVEFETKLPLAAGNYNLLISITEPLIANKSAKFIDVIEVAKVFTMLERPGARLWAKTYVKNTLNIRKVQNTCHRSFAIPEHAVTNGGLKKNSPTFLIIGAQKAGTTALFSLLAKHPKILAPKSKELNFFQDDKNFSKGRGWYHEQFPGEEAFSSGQITFEATPEYLYRLPAAQRIYDFNRSMKLIVLVRDPVERAFSAWNMYKNFRNSPYFSGLTEHRSFEQAIGQELYAIASGEHAPYSGFERQDNCSMPFPGYISRGIYCEQLERYFQIFDAGQLLVLHSDDLNLRKPETLRRVTDFLELEEFTPETPKGRAANEGTYSSEISGSLREILKEFYRPYNDRLYRLVGVNYGW